MDTTSIQPAQIGIHLNLSSSAACLESPHDFCAVHWDHEPRTNETGPARQGAADVSSAGLLPVSSAGKMPAARCGSWRAPFRFYACIGTMNPAVSGSAGLPAGETHTGNPPAG